MATINLYIYNETKDVAKYKLENIDLDKKVEFIKLEALNKCKLKDLNVLCHGNILNLNDTLSSCGISSGSLIQCLPKYNQDEDAKPLTPLTSFELQRLQINLKILINNPNFESFIKKLKSPKMSHKVLTECHFLGKDMNAFTFLQSPELFVNLVDGSDFEKILTERPAMGLLAQYLLTLSSEEVSSRSHHGSYSLDALSDDDEEMDAEQSGDSTAGSRASGSVAYQPITPGQLAAALASASGGSGPSRSSQSIPITPSSTTTPLNTPAASSLSGPSSGGMSEIISQALQNALAASASRSTSSPASGPSIPPSAMPGGPAMENLEESLQLMREMGIGDEQMSLQALQATNGDVTAAVNYIFAQLLADD